MVNSDVRCRRKDTFYLGKREVEVMFLDRGNTAGDAVVYVPDSKVSPLTSFHRASCGPIVKRKKGH